MNKKFSTEQLHGHFISCLADGVSSYSALTEKPLVIDLSGSGWGLRLYAYNLTAPPGGRASDELKIQLISPGQRRGEKGNFDDEDGRFVLLAGFEPTMSVWVLWDATKYKNFAWSRNVQIKAVALIGAVANGISETKRKTKLGDEVVVTCRQENLRQAIARRMTIWAQETMARSS